MAKDQELLIRINGTAKNFTDEIDKAKAKTKDLEKSLGKVAKVSSAAFIGLSIAVAGTVARFATFEKEFSNVVTLLDKGSFSATTLKNGIKGLESGILALRASSGESFDSLNKGLFDIISATGDAENAMSVLETATKLAIAGGTDVSTAVDGITGSIKAFEIETSQAQEVADLFFQAQKGGKTTVEELSSSIGQAASTANAYNVSLEELLAASSAATLAGITTASTFSGLKAAFASIAKPTEDAAREAARLGISFNTTALRAQGLEGFLNTLTSANGFTQKSIEKLFGSVEAQGILFSLTGAQAGDFASQIELLNDKQSAAATFTEAYNVKLATTDKAIARFTGSLDTLAVTFGSAFAPAINAGADALASIAISFSTLSPLTVQIIAGVVAFTTALAGLIATITLSTLAFLKIRVALTALSVGFGFAKAAAISFGAGVRIAALSVKGLIASTGIGLLVLLLIELVTNFNQTRAVAIGTFTAIGRVASTFAKSIADTFTGLGEILVGAFSLDAARIKSGLDRMANAVYQSTSKIGKVAGESFSTAYNKALAEGASVAPDVEAGSDDDVAAKAAEASEKRIEAKRLENEKLLGLEDEKNIADAQKKEEKGEQDLERVRRQDENRQALEAELQELTDEQRALLDERDLERFTNHGLTKENVSRELAGQQLQREVIRRRNYLRDEQLHGATVAKLNRLFASQEVEIAGQLAGDLVGLSQSKNESLQAIGKAASLVQIGIKTAEGATSAYAALAGIPFVGPALGALAAGAVISFGAEQASAVRSAKDGGFVPQAQGGSRDRVSMMLEPGELVVPKALAPTFAQSVGRTGSGGGSGSSMTEVVISFRDEAFEIIEEKLIERRRIEGIGLGALG